jgi:hypothetical protein
VDSFARFCKTMVCVGAVALLSACGANFNTAYRLREVEATPSILTIDAKQRNVLIAGKIKGDSGHVRRMCAEPSPDVFSVFAQSLGASLSMGKTSPEQVNAAASLALARAETGATISRTQTTNVVREIMFRTCERYLSGAIDANQFAIQAIRDQRMVVSVLAIEQLTGVVTPPTVVISASGNSSTGGTTGEGLKVLADAQKAVRTAENNVQTVSTKRSDLDNADPKCADLKDDETDAARKKKREDCKAADAAVAAAKKKLEAAQGELNDLNDLVRQGGLPTAAGTATDASVFAGLNRPSDAQMEDVTEAINNIVNHVYGQDEFLLFCIGELAKGSPAIKQACEHYVVVGIEADAKRRDPEAFERTFRTAQERDAKNFDQFWAAVEDHAKPGQSDPKKVSEIVRLLRKETGGAPFADAELKAMSAATKTKVDLEDLFKKLAPKQMIRLAQLGAKK